MRVRYLTHPQVQIDPHVPVPMWGLSIVGRERILRLINSNFLLGTTQVISSGEKKAVETGQMISAGLGVSLEVNEAMHENDRSATGYLPFDEFNAVANEFFAYPLRSVRGWERATDAQLRIVSAVEGILKQNRAGDILFVGHGAVGTLLLCHYLKVEISRIHDQVPGGGQFFTLLKETRQVLHSWRQIEETTFFNRPREMFEQSFNGLHRFVNWHRACPVKAKRPPLGAAPFHLFEALNCAKPALFYCSAASCRPSGPPFRR